MALRSLKTIPFTFPASVDDLMFLGSQLAIVAGGALVGWLLYTLVAHILGRLKSHSLSILPQHVLPHIHGALKWFFVACGVNISLYFIELSSALENRLHHLIYIVIAISIGWMLMGITEAVSDWLKQRYREDNTEILKYRSINTQLRVFTHVVIFIVWLFTAIAIIMTIPSLRSLGVSLFASAGVAGIVIGMAANPTLSNLIAGIQLALTQPIRIGDQIDMGNFSGIVEEIDSTYVVVRLWDRRRLIVPLNFFIQNQFENWTHMSNDSIITMTTLFVDSGVAIEPIRQELERLVQTLPLWDKKICTLEVVKMTEGKIAQLRASVSTLHPRNAFALQCQVREGMIFFIQQHILKAT